MSSNSFNNKIIENYSVTNPYKFVHKNDWG